MGHGTGTQACQCPLGTRRSLCPTHLPSCQGGLDDPQVPGHRDLQCSTCQCPFCHPQLPVLQPLQSPLGPPPPSGPCFHCPLNLPSCTEAVLHHTSPLHSPSPHLPSALGLVHWAPSCGQWTQPPQTVGSCPGVRAGWLSMGVRRWHGGCSQPPWAHLLLPKDTFLPGWQPQGVSRQPRVSLPQKRVSRKRSPRGHLSCSSRHGEL